VFFVLQIWYGLLCLLVDLASISMLFCGFGIDVCVLLWMWHRLLCFGGFGIDFYVCWWIWHGPLCFLLDLAWVAVFVGGFGIDVGVFCGFGIDFCVVFGGFGMDLNVFLLIWYRCYGFIVDASSISVFWWI